MNTKQRRNSTRSGTGGKRHVPSSAESTGTGTFTASGAGTRRPSFLRRMRITGRTQAKRGSIFALNRSLQAQEGDAIEQINAIFHKSVAPKAGTLKKKGILNSKNGTVASRVRRKSVGFFDLVKRSFSVAGEEDVDAEESSDDEDEEAEEERPVLAHGTRLPSGEGRVFAAIYEYESKIVEEFVARVFGFDAEDGEGKQRKVIRAMTRRSLRTALEGLLPQEKYARFAYYPFYAQPENRFLTDSQLEASLTNILKYTMIRMEDGQERAWETETRKRTEEEKVHSITMMALYLFRPYQKDYFGKDACGNLVSFCLGSSLMDVTPTVDLYAELERFMKEAHASEVFRFFVGVQKLEKMMTPPATNATQHVTNLEVGLDFCDFASKLYRKSFPEDEEEVSLTVSAGRRLEIEDTIAKLENLFYAEESNMNWGRDLYKMMKTIMKAFKGCRDENLQTLNEAYMRYVNRKRRRIWKEYKKIVEKGKEYSTLKTILLDNVFMQASLYRMVEQMDRIMLFAKAFVPEPRSLNQRGQGAESLELAKIDGDWEYDSSSSDESDISEPSRL